ncbi:uncharacterized protein LOC118422435 isoform X2 [Branchiostoma floridae]|uniref:Uncharacterized protein LOC118422435 isoform X2 n=1 Tax=Branchiostoma floridae TaxID=7739 RepID=A0A9J7MY68_BRAFL|nr:uncharacterized protein LOC118422435 isoform X2 [Branchiostoma floridae]
MTKDGFSVVYGVALLVVVVSFDNTSALSGPSGSVCGSQCCAGWDQVGDTCQHVDECWYGTHVCHHNCSNHEGCYTCVCAVGFQLINSTHCVSSTVSNINGTTAGTPLSPTVSDSLCATTAASNVGRTTTNPLQTTTRTEDGRDVTTTRTLPVTSPVVHDNDRSPAPRGKADHHNVDMVVGVAVSAVALVLLFVSIGIFIRYKKKKVATRQEQFNRPQQPRDSFPGYSDTYWRNPDFAALHEETPGTRSPPPPYEATGGLVALAEISKSGIHHKNVVGVAIDGVPAIASNCQDNGIKPPKKVPENEYEGLKRW